MDELIDQLLAEVTTITDATITSTLTKPLNEYTDAQLHRMFAPNEPLLSWYQTTYIGERVREMQLQRTRDIINTWPINETTSYNYKVVSNVDDDYDYLLKPTFRPVFTTVRIIFIDDSNGRLRYTFAQSDAPITPDNIHDHIDIHNTLYGDAVGFEAVFTKPARKGAIPRKVGTVDSCTTNQVVLLEAALLGRSSDKLTIANTVVGGSIEKRSFEEDDLIRGTRISNCLINVLQDSVKLNYPSICTSLGVKNPYTPFVLSSKQIDQLARLCGLRIKVYTAFGTLTKHLNDAPWMVYNDGKKHRATVNVTVSDNHARLLNEVHPAVDCVQYIDEYKRPAGTESLRSFNDALGYYVSRIDDTTTMYKSLRPSTVTKNPADDTNPAFFNVHTPNRVLFTSIVTANGIVKTPRAYTDVIKASIRYITRRVVAQPGSVVNEIDHIRSYSSGNTSKWYMGYPNTRFTVSNVLKESTSTKHTLQPAFVCVNSIHLSKHIEAAYNMLLPPTNVLTYPMYKYLISVGSTINIAYVIYAEFISFDLLNVEKLAANTFVGNLIAGVSTNNERFTCSVNELPQINAECERMQLVNNYDVCNGVVHCSVKIANRVSKYYHTHSYIIAYSHIFMLELASKVLAAGSKIYAYNTDAIYTDYADIYPGTRITYNKSIKFTNLQSDITQIDTVTHPTYMINHQVAPIRLIESPAGIGKSYPFLKTPMPSQLMMAPTLNLTADHASSGEGATCTIQSFLARFNDTSYQPPINIVADEIGQCTLSMVAALMEACGLLPEHERNVYTRSCKCNLTLLFGDGQLQNTYTNGPSDAVTLDGLKKLFERSPYESVIIHMKRTRDSICRQDYEYGSWLDTLRFKSPAEAMKLCVDYYPLATTIDYSGYFITGSWETANKYNLLALTHTADTHTADANSTNMPFKLLKTYKGQVKGSIQRLDVTSSSINDPLIWWTHTASKQHPPPGAIYEPIFAGTCDSFQGQTINCTLTVDLKSLTRPGAIYSTATRSRSSGSVQRGFGINEAP